MADVLVVRLPDLPKALAKLRPQLYRAALADLVRSATLLAEREARIGAPKDTGTLARSLVGQSRDLLGTVSSPLAYAAAMNDGRAPGARMPPPDALLGWMARHGIPADARFVVARAIGRRGIKGRFFMQRAKEAVQRQGEALAREAARRIDAAWGA